MTNAIAALDPKQSFNIVTFANHVRVFEKQLRRASPKHKQRAIAWVGGLELELETNIYDALELAFILGGRGVRDRYYEPEVDTIFFLSDGAPTMPKQQGEGFAQGRPRELLAEVRRWNALGRVAIHTIGLGLPMPTPQNRQRGRLARGFLRDLAAQNRGTFVEPR